MAPNVGEGRKESELGGQRSVQVHPHAHEYPAGTEETVQQVRKHRPGSEEARPVKLHLLCEVMRRNEVRARSYCVLFRNTTCFSSIFLSFLVGQFLRVRLNEEIINGAITITFPRVGNVFEVGLEMFSDNARNPCVRDISIRSRFVILYPLTGIEKEFHGFENT